MQFVYLFIYANNDIISNLRNSNYNLESIIDQKKVETIYRKDGYIPKRISLGIRIIVLVWSQNRYDIWYTTSRIKIMQSFDC